MHGFGRCVEALLTRVPPILATLALCLGVIGTAQSAEMKKKPWYGSLWPLGEHIEVETLKKEYVPFKTLGDIPLRPALFFRARRPVPLY